MNKLDFECKINSYRDPTNQTPEPAFSENSKKITLLLLIFNNIHVAQCSSGKQIGVMPEY